MPIAASSQYFLLNLHPSWAVFSGIDCRSCLLYNDIFKLLFHILAAIQCFYGSGTGSFKHPGLVPVIDGANF